MFQNVFYLRVFFSFQVENYSFLLNSLHEIVCVKEIMLNCSRWGARNDEVEGKTGGNIFDDKKHFIIVMIILMSVDSSSILALLHLIQVLFFCFCFCFSSNNFSISLACSGQHQTSNNFVQNTGVELNTQVMNKKRKKLQAKRKK